MYTIQHKDPVTRESKMKDCDVRDINALVGYLSVFQHPIFNVYENGNMITKKVRTAISDATARRNHALTLSAAARDFLNSPL